MHEIRHYCMEIIYESIHGSQTVLRVLTWDISFYPERKRGVKFTNILPIHVKTHNIV